MSKRKTPSDGLSPVRELRQKLALSTGAFASMLGVTENTVWRWENRGIKPSGSASAILGAIEEFLASYSDSREAETFIRNQALLVEASGGLKAMLVRWFERHIEYGKWMDSFELEDDLSFPSNNVLRQTFMKFFKRMVPHLIEDTMGSNEITNMEEIVLKENKRFQRSLAASRAPQTSRSQTQTKGGKHGKR